MNQKNCSKSLDGKNIECKFTNAKRKIYIETTTQCNNNCLHCFNRSGEKNYYLTEEDIVNLERDFGKFGTISQVLLSGGEFFSNQYNQEILKFLATKYNVKVLSNGRNIPDSFFDYLKNNKNVEIQITLNGPNKNIDGLIRGNCFDDTLNNIKKVVKNGCSRSLTVATTLFKGNISRIREMIDFCIFLGVRRIQFSFIYKLGRATDNWDNLSISSYEKLIALDEIQQFAEELHNKISIVSSGMRHFCLKIDPNEERNTCQELSEEIVITPLLFAKFCPKFDAYCECKGLENIKYSVISKGKLTVSNQLDSTCYKCYQFKECLASCVM